MPAMRPVLITAGATRNRIDAMRFLSAHSSGKTGAYIATALGPRDLMFLGSPEACLRAPQSIAQEIYTDTLDLLDRMRAWVGSNPAGLVVHAAAVGDYMIDPADPEAEGKRRSGQDVLQLRLVPTPKILDQVRGWSEQVYLISFKAAAPHTNTDELARIAAQQRVRTGSDLVFGNTIGRTDAEIVIVGADGAQVYAERHYALEALTAHIQDARLA